jgi:hypothetical protein
MTRDLRKSLPPTATSDPFTAFCEFFQTSFHSRKLIKHPSGAGELFMASTVITGAYTPGLFRAIWADRSARAIQVEAFLNSSLKSHKPSVHFFRVCCLSAWLLFSIRMLTPLYGLASLANHDRPNVYRGPGPLWVTAFPQTTVHR